MCRLQSKFWHRTALSCIAACLSTFNAYAQCPIHIPLGTNPVSYNLVDDLNILSQYPSYLFEYAKEGNLLDISYSNAGNSFSLTTPDDSTAQGDYQSELFVLQQSYSGGWDFLTWSSIQNISVTTNGNGSLNITGSVQDGNFRYYLLMRYLSFSPVSIQNSTRGLIVLIHGWNPSGASEGFVKQEWVRLRNEISAYISGTADWELIEYDWHKDASTGPIFDAQDLGFECVLNAPESAEIAHQHGQHLAEQILCQGPFVEKVHIIAHSAGAWAARSAASHLTSQAVGVQMTLLDPFVPNLINRYSVLLTDQISSVGSFPNVLRLENYFVRDFFTDNFNGNSSGNATSQTFQWQSARGDLNVDLTNLYPTFLAFHDDPIDWYADSVFGTHSIPVGAPNNIGWESSMFVKDSAFTPIPDAPEVVYASDGIWSNQIQLIWNRISEGNGYKVYRAAAQDGPYSLRFTINDPDTYTILDNVSCGQGYWYKVSTLIDGGESEKSHPDYGYTNICPLPVPEQATNPIPNIGNQNVSVTPVLSWGSSVGATSYDIYFGVDSTPDSGEFVGSVTSTSFAPGLLDGDTVYYWRVDAKNAEHTEPGDTWYFRTEDVPDPDDAYEPNDDIDEAWHPGWDWENTWLSTISGLAIQQHEQDWYQIDVKPGFERIIVNCTFSDAEFDLDIILHDANRTELIRVNSNEDNEFIDFTVPSAGTYFIRTNGGGSGSTYDLWWDDVPPEIDLEDGLIGLFTFEDGTAHNSVPGESALPDLNSSGVEFEGGSAVLGWLWDYLELPVPLGNSDFTLWIDATYDLSNSHRAIVSQELPFATANQDRDFNVYQFKMQDVSPNRLVTTFYGEGGGWANIISGIGLMDGTRRQIAVSWDGSTMGAAFDGNLDETTVQGWPDIDGFGVRFGKATFGTDASTGRIHEIRIYDRALREFELAALGSATITSTWVDFAPVLNGDGTFWNPFNNLADGLAAVSNGGLVNIAPGESSEVFVGATAIAKPLKLMNRNPAGGPVIIGRSSGRDTSASESGFVSRDLRE